MKYLLIVFIVVVSVFLWSRIIVIGNESQEEGVLYEGQIIAMPEYYRQITGYDSIQVLYYKKGSPLGKGWEGHFCYPNELANKKNGQ